MTVTAFPQNAQRLLNKDEPLACRIVKATKKRPLLLTCDHASNRIPASLCNLGLEQDRFKHHYAYDIGAEAVTQMMAQSLGAAAVFQNYSRMVIDCNRYLDQDSLIPEISDGLTIPGNQALTEGERNKRIDEIYLPYHAAIKEEADKLEADLKTPIAVVAIHSFTPCLKHNGTPRPWHIGILWRKDRAAAEKLMTYLGNTTDWTIGNNEPYSMLKDRSYTINHHAEDKGRGGLLIEMRQDEIANEAGQKRFADRLVSFFDSYEA